MKKRGTEEIFIPRFIYAEISMFEGKAELGRKVITDSEQFRSRHLSR